MKAFAITGLKDAGYADVAEPEVGPGQVRLEIKYVGFCGSDLNTYRGLNPLVRLPRIPGHEISAVIAEKGAGVPDAWKVGQRVTVSPYTNCGLCSSCLKGRPNCCRYNETLGVQRDGALTKFIVVPWEKLYDADGIAEEHIELIEPLTVGGHAADRSEAMEDDVAAGATLDLNGTALAAPVSGAGTITNGKLADGATVVYGEAVPTFDEGVLGSKLTVDFTGTTAEFRTPYVVGHYTGAAPVGLKVQVVNTGLETVRADVTCKDGDITVTLVKSGLHVLVY